VRLRIRETIFVEKAMIVATTSAAATIQRAVSIKCAEEMHKCETDGG